MLTCESLLRQIRMCTRAMHLDPGSTTPAIMIHVEFHPDEFVRVRPSKILQQGGAPQKCCFTKPVNYRYTRITKPSYLVMW
jgi:hypothetical protein